MPTVRVALLMLSLLLLPGCLVKVVEEDDGTSNTSTTSATSTPAAGGNRVRMHDGRYDRASLTVPYNTTVRFVAEDGTHSVASTNGVYDQGDVPQGTSVLLLANLAGTYTLQCRFHADMRMTFTVKPA